MKSMIRPVLFSRAIIFAAIFTALCTGALAKESALNYLKEGKPDAASLLTPPPLPD